jgi:hypothetical protein
LKRLIFAASCGAAAIFPAVSFAQRPTRLHVRQYERAYAHAKRVFGKQTVGCRLLASCRGGVSDARMVASTNVLHRLFARPPAPAPAPVAYTTQATSTPVVSSPSYSAGGYTIPAYIVQCESGGNYSAVNPQTAAGGAYQILPSTWQAYGGTGSPQDASPAEQGQVAARIYADRGASAWTCGSGG